jgi:hypothetical protein
MVFDALSGSIRARWRSPANMVTLWLYGFDVVEADGGSIL